MYVLRYRGVDWLEHVVFLSCGCGDGSHIKALFGTDCLWLVPGTLTDECFT